MIICFIEKLLQSKEHYYSDVTQSVETYFLLNLKNFVMIINVNHAIHEITCELEVNSTRTDFYFPWAGMMPLELSPGFYIILAHFEVKY